MISAEMTHLELSPAAAREISYLLAFVQAAGEWPDRLLAAEWRGALDLWAGLMEAPADGQPS